MFTFDRETAIIVAIIVCIAASAYMYKELKSTKQDLEDVKGFNGKLVSFLSSPPPSPPKKVFSESTQVEIQKEKNQDSEEESSE